MAKIPDKEKGSSKMRKNTDIFYGIPFFKLVKYTFENKYH